MPGRVILPDNENSQRMYSKAFVKVGHRIFWSVRLSAQSWKSQSGFEHFQLPLPTGSRTPDSHFLHWGKPLTLIFTAKESTSISFTRRSVGSCLHELHRGSAGWMPVQEPMDVSLESLG